MSLLSWFTRRSESSNTPMQDSARPQTGKSVPAPASKPHLSPEAHLIDRKVKRHARREQLYVAIRECMTRAGVLSASYKFKVLSLDQLGNQFLVMMDIAPELGGQPEKLAAIETLLISTAKSLFSIYVTSVYWRTDNRPVAANVVNVGVSHPVAPESQPIGPDAAQPAPQKSTAQHYDPIHDEEMVAFKQALEAASAQKPATADGTGKSRSGLRSFTLITGFEDTEMTDSSAAPALSATQYGELR